MKVTEIIQDALGLRILIETDDMPDELRVFVKPTSEIGGVFPHINPDDKIWEMRQNRDLRGIKIMWIVTRFLRNQPLRLPINLEAFQTYDELIQLTQN